jgi:two-component sensor histidine kinase
MDDWVARLRAQAAGIASGTYEHGSAGFARAPGGIADLSRDLDNLARLMAQRETVRKALAHEVHHRVKNNLQIVTSLLEMQASGIANPAARKALGQTRARIAALALIQRILYEQDDDGSQATLDIARLIDELCAQFRLWNRHRSEIAIMCHADTLAAPLDHALPLALFAVEAATNAYAYAFPQGRDGKVDLRFDVAADGKAMLRICDDGVGFDTSARSASMGRQLMLGFARQLGGAVTIRSSAGAGTEVRLDYGPVPVAESRGR